ncbi:tyrosine-type recombinase/integrase [Lacrimispora sp.]|uniref:tyrosine-type recombinase/integrase n=1 Tax=Lacrimispora sp. TaxID=2719234 RepID=UPI0039937F9E
MNGQTVKAQVINNIIVAMADHVAKEVLDILYQVIVKEFVNVNMEEITTLPAEYQNDTDQKNKYIIQLFLVKKKIKDNTKEAYLSAVKRLITLIDKPLDKIEESDISYYLSWYEKRNLNVGGKKNQAVTVNNERRFLSAFFTWMRKEKLIGDNPVEATDPLKAIRKPIDYFKPEEMAKMRDACKNLRERALIEVLRSTGARVGELVEITLDQIDWNTGDIMIQGEKNDRYEPIFLDDEARYYYRQYLDSRNDDSSFMFPQCKAPHEQMSTSGIRSILKTIGNRAKLKCRVYPHKLRKTLGMNLKNKGVDLGTIQEILRHSTPSVTAIYYAQSTPNTLRSVRERCSA